MNLESDYEIHLKETNIFMCENNFSIKTLEFIFQKA